MINPENKGEKQKTDREILGLAEGETSVEKIKKAFWKRVKKTHPDAGGSETAFKEVDAAYKRIIEEIATMSAPKNEKGKIIDPNVAEAVRIYQAWQKDTDQTKTRDKDPFEEFDPNKDIDVGI